MLYSPLEIGVIPLINIREFLGLGYYESELDQFLKHYDKTHPKLSASQRAEVEKYKRVYRLRDDSNQPEPKISFWKYF